MLGAEAGVEMVEFVLVFGGEDGEGAAGEAVAEVVETGGGFAGSVEGPVESWALRRLAVI